MVKRKMNEKGAFHNFQCKENVHQVITLHDKPLGLEFYTDRSLWPAYAIPPIDISDDKELPLILPDNYYQVACISDVEFICIDFKTIDKVKMTLEHVVQSVEIEDQLRRDTEDVKRTLNCIIETVITNEEIAFKQINETHVRSEVQEVVVGLVGTVALTPVAAVLLADESDSTDSDNEN